MQVPAVTSPSTRTVAAPAPGPKAFSKRMIAPPRAPLRRTLTADPLAIVSHTTQSGRLDPLAEHWRAMSLEKRMTVMAGFLGRVWVTVREGWARRQARSAGQVNTLIGQV
jgi:hypothetical protein